MQSWPVPPWRICWPVSAGYKEKEIRLLKQPNRIPDYEKNKDCFDVLKPLQATAIQRAKTRASQIQNQGIEPISRQSNPLTTVWELVEYLNSKI